MRKRKGRIRWSAEEDLPLYISICILLSCHLYQLLGWREENQESLVSRVTNSQRIEMGTCHFQFFFSSRALFAGSHFRFWIVLDFLCFGHFVEVGISGSCNFVCAYCLFWFLDFCLSIFLVINAFSWLFRVLVAGLDLLGYGVYVILIQSFFSPILCSFVSSPLLLSIWFQ